MPALKFKIAKCRVKLGEGKQALTMVSSARQQAALRSHILLHALLRKYANPRRVVQQPDCPWPCPLSTMQLETVPAKLRTAPMHMELGRLHERLNPGKPAAAVSAYKAVLRYVVRIDRRLVSSPLRP